MNEIPGFPPLPNQPTPPPASSGVGRRAALTVAALLAVGGGGAAVGALTYASMNHGGTTTVIRNVSANGTSTATEAALSITDIAKRTTPGVVDLVVTSSSTNGFFSQPQTAEGSGFVYDTKGDIVTNEHVVAGATSIKVNFPSGVSYVGKLIGVDASTDLAVVRVKAPASALHPLALGDSSKVQVGDPVIAIGSPFGYRGTVTSGIVSALHRQMTSPDNYTIADSIQTDAPINHGNSGGPLISASGQVIGVNAQIQSDSGGSDGVGFAIPANTIQIVVSQLVTGKSAKHAYLGVSIGTPVNGTGAQIDSTVTGGPADKAGLAPGDVITQIGTSAIASPNDLTGVVDSFHPGQQVKVTYKRGGNVHTVTLTLGTRPS